MGKKSKSMLKKRAKPESSEEEGEEFVK